MARPEDLDPTLADLGVRVRAALVAAGLPGEDPAFERPRQAEHGDWATSVCLRLAKPAKKSPRAIAEALVANLALPDEVTEVEIAGPGFINFRFAPAYWDALVPAIVAAGEQYGRRAAADDAEIINVEFVSANPTGPLHAGAGRWAATGDAIAALLEANGAKVVREYYVNDAGEQIRKFGESVTLLGLGESLDQEHYQGAYVGDLAEALRKQHGDEVFTTAPDSAEPTGPAAAGVSHDGTTLDDGESDRDADAGTEARVDAVIAAHVGELAVEQMRAWIEGTLHGMGVDYDVWFSERRELHDTGAIDQAIADLKAAGQSYEKDDAVFLKTEQFGDDKDRVLVRGDGRPTYFAADCAYLRSKWSRADRLYYMLGADHHGYVGRIKAAAQCLGIPADAVEIRIGQLVNLLRAGEPVKMSKRAGTFISLDEVIEEVGVDVARYNFLRQSLDTTVDFDLAVVTEQSMENPIFYVQYAHARATTLLRAADDSGFAPGAAAEVDGSLLVEAAEIELRNKLAGLPEAVADAAEARATQRLTRYVEELAAAFHRFYADCRVLVDDAELAKARYWLVQASRIVLANGLGMLRVSAPDRM
ncbi:MAG: arginyl-tRNA synthetase [Glaciecola sp.]|jgi:arginyl-tRNA synthetase